MSQFQLGFPSCKEVSAREEADVSMSNEPIQPLRSVHTIGTSPEIMSRRTSRQPSNALTFARIGQSPVLSPF